MKNNNKHRPLAGCSLLLLLSTLIIQPTTSFAQGTAFTYQGRLTDGTNAANGTYDLRFYLRDAVTSGNPVGTTNTVAPVAASNGLFAVTLDFGAGIFTGPARWLEIGVRTNGSAGAYTTLSPRQPLTPAPYAITAGSLTGTLPAGQLSGTLPSAQWAGTYANAVTLNNAANSFSGNGAGLSGVNALTLGGFGPGSFWQLLGNGGTTAGINFLGTTDDQPLELKVNGQRALRLEPTAADVNHASLVNVVGGSSVNSIAPGVYGSAIVGGGAVNYFGVHVGNSISADVSFVGGGLGNSIQTDASYSAIGGGGGNLIRASSSFSFLGGGSGNVIETNAAISVLGGGYQNAIGAGSGVSFLGAGQGNSIQDFADASVLGGGFGNSIQSGAYRSFLGGGEANSIETEAFYSVLGGGTGNSIQTFADYSVLGGGDGNSIQTNAFESFLGGGVLNFISPGARDSFLGGGGHNTITGRYGVIPGGDNNVAGTNSFAAGHRAKATHTGAFVWGDSTDADFGTTSRDQFLIRATGGVGIGTSSPASQLHVAGDTRISGVTQIGSGTGNAEAPDKGLILRRAKSTVTTLGSVVARTDKLTLERDGSSGGWRIANIAAPGNTIIAATGLTSTGATVNFVTSIVSGAGAGTTTVFNNTQNVIAFRCSFGDSFGPGHMTEVSLSRFPADPSWTGTITSTFNQ